MSEQKPFWEIISLDEMSTSQWEQLCDGCGLCCLNKLEDEETEEIYLTRVACNLLDKCTATCSNYADRFSLTDECIQITPEVAHTAPWLPSSCAYRLLAEGEPLAWWHPLISGDKQSIINAGISVSNKVIHENEMKDREYAEFIINEEEFVSALPIKP